ncbi:MAG TPA: GAF domain-containing protein [Verrucomicrobiae bacterium]
MADQSREIIELAELKRRHERLDLLYKVSNVIHSTLEPHHALELIVGEAVNAMRATSGSVVIVNPTTEFLEIQASVGLPPDSASLKLRLGEGITGWVAQTGKSARIGDVRKDPRYILAREKVLSELAVPFEIAGQGRGVLNVDSDRLNAFDESDEKLLNDLAALASNVIKNTWLYEQIRLKARWFEALFNVGQTITSTLNVDDALKVITHQACDLMGAKMSSLLMLDETREWLDLRASYGAGSVYIKKPRLSVAESALGAVVRRKKSLQIPNVQISSRYQNVEVARREQLVSLLSVPLLFRNEAIGALNVYTAEPHSFSNEEVRVLAALAQLSGIAIEKARLYERIVDIEEQLRTNEKLSALGLLAAEVAHEIRNPLTVIKMLFHSLDLSFGKKDPRARDVEVMREKMDHLNRIVEQILDFARSADPNFAPINVNSVVEDLGLLTRHKLTNQNIELIRELDPNLPFVMADVTQLEQVFLNLTLNAVDAMPEGGHLHITTRSEENGARVIIGFRDTGHGMTQAQCEKIFKSLLTTTKKKGTGLGLAIVARIIEAHHGTIEVKSRKGKGATFTISLPALPPS